MNYYCFVCRKKFETPEILWRHQVKHNNITSNRDLNYSNQIQKPIIRQKIRLVVEIDDLIDLIEFSKRIDVDYLISSDIEYNIDLQMLKNLLPDMINLNNMIGQNKIKNQVANLILYYSLHLNKKEDDLLHTIIDGEPGTGKTEFAQKIAKIYLKMGVLKRDVFKKVKRSDLIAGYLGQTALKTQDILNEVKGGVLFIDEAYSLGNNSGKDSGDSYSKECIDLLNQSLTEMRDKPDDYFIMIVAGYKEDLKKSFFGVNDGLERRFSINFSMESYSSNDLVKIFIKKVKDNYWNILDDAIDEKFIEDNKQYFKYHGGDMELLFMKCKVAHSKNLIRGKNDNKSVLNKNDIIDGMKIFIDNSNVRERHDEIDNIKLHSMYT